MPGTKRQSIFLTAILALALAVAGCTTTGSSSADIADSGTDVAAASGTAGDSGAKTTTDDETATGASTSEKAAAATGENQESHYDADDLEYDESSVVEIELDGSSATADGDGVVIDGSVVTITDEGAYLLSGSLSDGEIVVEAGDSDDVTLILDGVDITNSDGAAIAVMNVDDVVILLAEGSTNRLTDGDTYVFPDADTDEPNATLYSSADMTIAGEGELIVDSNYNDGITSKDGLVIESGTIIVIAVDDGIRGKDYVIIDGGSITVAADGDGIQADNDEDADRGYVLITGGFVDVTAGDDGIQAETDALVTGGALVIDAGSVSSVGRAIQAETMVVISGGSVDATAIDDAIHSNDAITIDGGIMTLASGDDAIHGDYTVTINGGTITITEAFEGIESEVLTINDGFIDVTSDDDGLNVASAEASSATSGRDAGGGTGEFHIYINGGTTIITVTGELEEQGDGIDSNGYVEMTGGVVVVNGPTDTRNSALDYNGNFVMSGGLFIGTNIDGRHSSGTGSGSTQASLYLTSDSVISAGTVIHIETTGDDSLVTFEPANQYNVIVFSSPDLSDGESYEIELGGTVSGESSTGLYDDSAYTPGDLAGTVTASL